MATIKLKGGKVVLKDGKVSCSCCGFPECLAIDYDYDIISESMYNSLRSGGNFIVNGAISENFFGPPYTCSLNESSSGIVPSGTCTFGFGVSEKTCNDPYNPYSHYQNAQISIALKVSKVGNQFRLTYYGSGWCPYQFSIQYFQCYSIGWQIGWGYDNNPSFLVNLGSVTINTSAGTLGPYGIWSFPNAGSASLDVTLTPS